jgi:hypothetical protein
MKKLGVPRGAPLVIGYDGQAPERLAELKKSFNVIVPGDLPGFARECTLPSGRSPPPVIVDMLLMLRAPAFIGNPQSTVSFNIAAARSNQLEEPRQNLRRNLLGLFPLPGGAVNLRPPRRNASLEVPPAGATNSLDGRSLSKAALRAKANAKARANAAENKARAISAGLTVRGGRKYGARRLARAKLS